MVKKKRQKKCKIISRVSETDYRRLERITHIYGFRSVYALLNYIALCFLRAVDRAHDPSTDILPEEIIRMFPIKEDAKEVYQALRIIRAKHNRQTAKARMEKERDMFESPDDAISEEVQDMFDEAQDIGRGSEFADNLRKRSER
jgi:hypothetical protein